MSLFGFFPEEIHKRKSYKNQWECLIRFLDTRWTFKSQQCFVYASKSWLGKSKRKKIPYTVAAFFSLWKILTKIYMRHFGQNDETLWKS